jgi:FtsZ-interacting cell division protein ZipA
MANISRPFQVALAGVVLLAAVWLFALRGHSSPTEPTPAASAPTASASSSAPSPSAAAAQEKSAAAKTPVYHGSAPGVQGLSSAIAKAHHAVATSQANARQLEEKSAQASGTSTTPSSGSTSAPAASAPAASSATSTRSASAAKPSTAQAQTKAATPGSATHRPSPSTFTATRQVAVEQAIARGDTAVILFWDAKGAEDLADAAVVKALRRANSHVAVELATANEVAAFGTITRGVQVYGTPTILVVAKSGQATVLTGLTDRFALAQAIDEARKAA